MELQTLFDRYLELGEATGHINWLIEHGFDTAEDLLKMIHEIRETQHHVQKAITSIQIQT